MTYAMESSPFQKFRDIIEFNYSPEAEEELDNEADDLMKNLDYQAAKRFEDPQIFDFENDDWDFRDPPDWSL